VGLNQEEGTIVQKVTIIPRGQAGGYNLMTPKEDKFLNTKKDLLDQIVSLLGGRCAEEIFFDDITTGASNDIEKATHLARDMVTVYGMSELGPIQYDRGGGNVFLGRDYTQTTNLSGDVMSEIDQQVRKIIDECHEEATKIIMAHKKELTAIAEALIEVETLTSEEIKAIYDGNAKIIDGHVYLENEIKGEDVIIEPKTNEVKEDDEIETIVEDQDEKE
ncbi:MAG: cell division protein FtsH, partial [Erysipelotrichaceae bacterium]|nr:cell division protein FtsH [Erysipelotrichaceae bacterium]